MDVERILAATEAIITPVAVVDEEVVERNLARMAKLAADNHVKLRPHAKTHKSAYMAQRQIAHGIDDAGDGGEDQKHCRQAAIERRRSRSRHDSLPMSNGPLFSPTHHPHGARRRSLLRDRVRCMGEEPGDALREKAAAPVVAQVDSPGIQGFLDFLKRNRAVEIDGQLFQDGTRWFRNEGSVDGARG